MVRFDVVAAKSGRPVLACRMIGAADLGSYHNHLNILCFFLASVSLGSCRTYPVPFVMPQQRV